MRKKVKAGRKKPQPSAFERLWLERFHGFANHRAVLYHALYASWRCFDLLVEPGPDLLVCEGIEDVDLKGESFGHEYIQLKSQNHKLTVPELGEVLLSFARALDVDSSARFKLITLNGFASTVGSYGDEPQQLVLEKVPTNLADVVGYHRAREVIARTHLQVLSFEELESRLEKRALEGFELTNNTVRFYASALLVELANRASTRSAFRRNDLAAVRVSVYEELTMGAVNPAVQSKLVEQLVFEVSGNPEDYYNGRAARSSHIAAGVDTRRPDSLKAIDDALKAERVCVVIASSGQGKSSLALRYLFDTAATQTIFQVRGCADELQAGAIADFLENRLRLGVPLNVLFDNLSERLRGWHLLVSRLIDKPVSFLITTREEDWWRYGQPEVDFALRAVRPVLALKEAREIFDQLRAKGKVHSSVKSAEQAYARVSSSKLLIEFVYLVTHGEMLGERLKQQVDQLAREDGGKVSALRLVSVADRYQFPLKIGEVLQLTDFKIDAQFAFQSLVDEYIVVEGDECFGLHPVRSDHLFHILHPQGALATVLELASTVRPDQLPVFAFGALIDPKVDRDKVMAGLISRCCEEPSTIGTIWEASYRAGQEVKVQENIDVFRGVRDHFGNPGLTMLSYLAMPNQSTELNELYEIMAPQQAEILRNSVAEARSRHQGSPVEQAFVEGLLGSSCLDHLRLNTEAVVTIGTATVAANLPPEPMLEILNTFEWRDRLLTLEFPALCELSLILQRLLPAEYCDWYADHRALVLARFKLATSTLGVCGRKHRIGIRFVVDPESQDPSPKEQALSRLKALAALCPTADTFHSKPILPYPDDNPDGAEMARVTLRRDQLIHGVDIVQNRSWREAIDRLQLAESLTEWIDVCRQVDADARSLLRYAFECFCAMLGGSNVNGYLRRNSADTYDRWSKHSRLLPQLKDPHQVKTLSKPAEDWVANAGNVIEQSFQFLTGKAQNDNPLHFIYQALGHLRKAIEPFHRALRHSSELEGLEKLALSTESDLALVDKFHALIAYLEANQPFTEDMVGAAVEWSNRRDSTTLQRIRAALDTALPKLAPRISVPREVLKDLPCSKVSDPPARTIIICLGVESIRRAGKEMDEVLKVAVRADPSFVGVIYIIGAQGNLLLRNFRRAPSDGALESIDPWVLVFLKLSEQNALPSLDGTEYESYQRFAPPELLIVEAYNASLSAVAVAAKTSSEASARLNPAIEDEAKLRTLVEVETERILASGQHNNYSRQLDLVQTGPVSRPAWDRVLAMAHALPNQIAGDPTLLPQRRSALCELVEEYLDSCKG